MEMASKISVTGRSHRKANDPSDARFTPMIFLPDVLCSRNEAQPR
jgi:hypothetical protein